MAYFNVLKIQPSDNTGYIKTFSKIDPMWVKTHKGFIAFKFFPPSVKDTLKYFVRIDPLWAKSRFGFNFKKIKRITKFRK